MDSKRDEATEDLERQIGAWRDHVRRRGVIAAGDADEMEDHLREQIATLGADGLAHDEAFLVAVKRLGAIDALTQEFARVHSERLWKQLVLSGEGWGADGTSAGLGDRRLWVALGLAVAAGMAIKLPALFGVGFADPGRFYALNLAPFVFPFVAAWLAWNHAAPRFLGWGLAGVFLTAALGVNLFPFAGEHADTATLTMIHLPIALWLVVGVAYVGGRWAGSPRRMDFIRFTGELFVYFVLLALGGAVLIGLTVALFEAIGLRVEALVEDWILPCGAAGAAVVAAWLVEAKQSVIENIAPVLTRVFAPLFVLVLAAYLVTMAVTGRGVDVSRDVLIVFDLLLVVVFGVLLYSFSARDPLAAPSLLDWIQLALVVAALAVDLQALWAIGSRISEFGLTPNRVAALGENGVLLVNLVGSTWLYGRFLRGRGTFTRLLDWQMFYLYVLAGWAALVAFGFPVLFGFQ